MHHAQTRCPDWLNLVVASANPSISGGTGLENNYIADGVSITDRGIGVYSRIYGSLSSRINLSFANEVDVKTGGFAARPSAASPRSSPSRARTHPTVPRAVSPRPGSTAAQRLVADDFGLNGKPQRLNLTEKTYRVNDNHQFEASIVGDPTNGDNPFNGTSFAAAADLVQRIPCGAAEEVFSRDNVF